MTKKAAIIVELVPEAETEANEQIKLEILKETLVTCIPFCAEIAHVEIEETKTGLQTSLQKEGISENVAKNVSHLYFI